MPELSDKAHTGIWVAGAQPRIRAMLWGGDGPLSQVTASAKALGHKGLSWRAGLGSESRGGCSRNLGRLVA